MGEWLSSQYTDYVYHIQTWLSLVIKLQIFFLIKDTLASLFDRSVECNSYQRVLKF